ncbi:MAG: Rne/Rng family ribonuclease [Candidatus Acidiferrales bacterium]
MSKEMVISANPHETRVAILEEGQLCEYYVEREKEFALVGSIYKGKVTRVLPGMQSAFVEIGLDSDAFLYVSDFLEEIEELDHIVEDKTTKIELEGGSVIPAAGSPVVTEPADVESGAALEALPGEQISSSSIPGAQSNVRNSSSAPSADRGRFENRPQGHRPGGDRGGRNNFSRRGGRGRQGGGGRGGRGGDRHFSRELPSSKYASPRPFEEQPGESNSAEGHISVLLPGESLAKYRDKTPSSTAIPFTQHDDASTTQLNLPPLSEDVTTNDSALVASTPEAAEHKPQEHQHLDQPYAEDQSARQERFEHQPFTQSPAQSQQPSVREDYSMRSSLPRASSAGIQPLPGESLSKWKTHQHLPPEPPEPELRAQPNDDAPVPDAVRFAPLSPLVPTGPEVDSVPTPDAHVEGPGAAIETRNLQHDGPQSEGESLSHETSQHFRESEHHEVLTHHDEQHHPELTDEEATAVAEHIAEAQDDLAARDERERSYAEADAKAEAAALESAEEEHEGEDPAGDASDSDQSSSDDAQSEDFEDAELEQEEAAAEEEGMIAHPEEEPRADHSVETEHADGVAEDGAPISGQGSASQPQRQVQARVRNDFRSRMQNPSRRGRDRGRRDDRGRRPQHGHSGGHGHRPQQPRRTQLIADMLKQGQEIIVQIAKEPLGKKGARITSHVALPGRFLVYMPTLDHTGVSRKIASAEERARLRHLVNEAKGESGGGFIVRTAAGSAAPDEVRADVEFLTRTWAEIKARSEQRKAPSLLHRDLNLVERILRDFITPDFGAIWVDTEEEYTKVVDFMSRFQPQLVNRVKLYSKSTPVFEEFGIQQEIDKGLRPKVWLKSGGYIVINHTEALVAIDVNTGKFVGKGSNRLEDTIVRTNLEACKEIVRQMRLRDLGGIIIIDFIDMEERRNREKVMAALEDALRADRAPSKVLRFNEFGLVAITRKRTKQALERTLCQPCPYCTGSGMVKSIPTLCYEIQTEARKMAPDIDSGSITLRVHPEISKALKTRESSLIEELERWTKKSLIIQADPTLHWEQYDIY